VLKLLLVTVLAEVIPSLKMATLACTKPSQRLQDLLEYMLKLISACFIEFPALGITVDNN